jgi:hypothetical protein
VVVMHETLIYAVYYAPRGRLRPTSITSLNIAGPRTSWAFCRKQPVTVTFFDLRVVEARLS